MLRLFFWDCPRQISICVLTDDSSLCVNEDVKRGGGQKG